MLGVPFGRTALVVRSLLDLVTSFLMGYGLGAIADTAPMAIGLSGVITTLGLRWKDARNRRIEAALESRARASDQRQAGCDDQLLR